MLVTSPEAAACHDMLKVLRRFAWIAVKIYAVPVQGDGAARRIASAISHLKWQGGSCSAQVIAAGARRWIAGVTFGRSMKKSWPGAIAASRIPIVSGIGHEVDVSIADLVADYHAHTPTEAAQVVTANWRAAREGVAELRLRLGRAFRGVLQEARHRLVSIERHEAFRRPLDRIHSYRQFLDDRQVAMMRALTERVHAAGRQVQELDGSIESVLRSAAAAASGSIGGAASKAGGCRAAIWVHIASAEVSLRLAALLVECHPRVIGCKRLLASAGVGDGSTRPGNSVKAVGARATN